MSKISIMQTLAVLAIVLCLTACGSTPGQRNIPGHVTYLSDGSHGYVITCDGFSGMTDCVKRAGDICLEKGYTVVQSETDPALFAKPVLARHQGITIRCNTPDGLYPLDESAVSP